MSDRCSRVSLPVRLCVLSSAVEHILHTDGVAGSNPAARTILSSGVYPAFRRYSEDAIRCALVVISLGFWASFWLLLKTLHQIKDEVVLLAMWKRQFVRAVFIHNGKLDLRRK